jgi:peptidoglycan/xylan/chitin deacetylase (PgdA/CDA1 family)
MASELPSLSRSMTGMFSTAVWSNCSTNSACAQRGTSIRARSTDPITCEKDEIVSLYAGHEIAGHSVSHPHLDNLDDENIIAEVGDDLRALEDITGAPVRGFAYPYGNYSPRVIRVLETLDLAYARTCENAHDPFPWSKNLRGRRRASNTRAMRTETLSGRNSSAYAMTPARVSAFSCGATPSNGRTTGLAPKSISARFRALAMFGMAPTSNCGTTKTSAAHN